MCQYDDMFSHLTAVLGYFIADLMGIRGKLGPLIVMSCLLRDIYNSLVSLFPFVLGL
jgi:hypothetical protein